MSFTQQVLLCVLSTLTSASCFGQSCNEKILPTAPNSRFEISGNETRDLKTGLVWQRCNAGQAWNGESCSGSTYTYTWAQALSLANGQWRLPNIRELASIIENACVDPSINTTVFPDTASDFYWSSSQLVRDQSKSFSNSWGVDFNSGKVSSGSVNIFINYYTDDYAHVRLVKGGN